MTHKPEAIEATPSMKPSSNVRRFEDFGAVTPGRIGTSSMGFIPGGSYQRGHYPALDRELDSLKQGLQPVQPEQPQR